MSNIRQQLLELVAERLETAPDIIERAETLADHGDSLAFIDLISEVEQKLKIHISNEELEQLNSFHDLVRIVGEHTGSACATS
jgi:acyl carrier protein